MHEQKGIIMKLSGSHAVVLTSDRQFLQIPTQAGMKIGQEVEIPRVVVKPSFRWKQMTLVAASLALALGVWQLQSSFHPNRVYAYVAIDINPSLELAVDKDKDVVEATPLNADAEKLILNMNLKGKPVKTAVNELATEAAKQGYVKSEGEILVTASDAGAAQMDIKSLEQDLISSVQETLKQSGLATNVGGVVVSDTDRKEAKKVGLSPGKYAVYKQAQVSGLDVTVDELKKGSVSSFVQEHGKNVREIVQSMKGDKKLDELLKAIEEKKIITVPADDDKNKREKNQKHNNRPGANGQGRSKENDQGKGSDKEQGKDTQDKNQDNKGNQDKNKDNQGKNQDNKGNQDKNQDNKGNQDKNKDNKDEDQHREKNNNNRDRGKENEKNEGKEKGGDKHSWIPNFPIFNALLNRDNRSLGGSE